MDTAIRQLQREFYITVAGSERKINAKGEPYGWAVNRYQRVEAWAPASWLGGAKDWEAEEARALILDDSVAISNDVDRLGMAKKFGFA